MFNDNKIKKLLDIKGFNNYCKQIITYSTIFPDIYLQFGLYLKKHHNYKNNKLVKFYTNNIDIEYIINDIIKFLREQYQKFYNKVYRIVYKAIKDRDENG